MEREQYEPCRTYSNNSGALHNSHDVRILYLQLSDTVHQCRDDSHCRGGGYADGIVAQTQEEEYPHGAYVPAQSEVERHQGAGVWT